MRFAARANDLQCTFDTGYFEAVIRALQIDPGASAAALIEPVVADASNVIVAASLRQTAAMDVEREFALLNRGATL